MSRYMSKWVDTCLVENTKHKGWHAMYRYNHRWVDTYWRKIDFWEKQLHMYRYITIWVDTCWTKIEFQKHNLDMYRYTNSCVDPKHQNMQKWYFNDAKIFSIVILMICHARDLFEIISNYISITNFDITQKLIIWDSTHKLPLFDDGK